jgi:hypothetical protein
VSEVKSSASGRAIVVDIDDRNAGHSYLIHSALTTSRVTVDISTVSSLYLVVLNAGVSHGTSYSDFTQGVVIVVVLARLVEASHSVSDDENASVVLFNHELIINLIDLLDVT